MTTQMIWMLGSPDFIVLEFLGVMEVVLFHIICILMGWVLITREHTLRWGLKCMLFIWWHNLREDLGDWEEWNREVWKDNSKLHCQVRHWGLGFWISISLGSSEGLCGCTSELSVWRAEDKLINPHFLLVRGYPMGCWISVISSSTNA